MLTKNIFFLYSPGYAGNYLQWAVNRCEQDMAAKTIADPFTADGTTHGFVRKPTHMGPLMLLPWITRNRPATPQTYVVTCYKMTDRDWACHAAWAAWMLMRAVPDSLIVNIHAATDDERKYGALNCHTKWPSFYKSDGAYRLPDYFDFDHDAGHLNKPASLRDRNWFVKYWDRLPWNPCFNWQEFEFNMNMDMSWYHCRNTLHPHEVNESQFEVFDQVPYDRVLDVNVLDITEPDFFSRVMAPWLSQQQAGTFDWTEANAMQGRFRNKQTNLAWLASLENFRSNRVVGPAIMHSSLTQAFALLEVQQDLASIYQWEMYATDYLLRKLGYTFNETA